MIFGIGHDITDISRIENAMKNPRFLLRFFSDAERELFTEKGFAPQTVAANFAGKEAFAKALGTGIDGFSLCDVSVLREKNGKPYLMLQGRAKEVAENTGISLMHISLTHTDAIASAFVVLEKKTEGDVV